MAKQKNKINASCFNEHGTLQTVAVCSPALHAPKSQLECSYQLFLQPVSVDLLKQDHHNLCCKLAELDVEVVDLAEVDIVSSSGNNQTKISDLLPNRIFVRDIAAAMGNNLVMGRAASVCRYPEFNLSQMAINHLVDNNVNIFEGNELFCGNESLEFGDLLVLNKDAFLLNYGNRTQAGDASWLMRKLLELGFQEGGIISVPAETDNIHLDLTCNILGDDLVIALEPLRCLPVQLYSSNKPPEYTTTPEFFKRHSYDIRYFMPQGSPDFLTNYIHIDKSNILMSSRHQRRFASLAKERGITIHTVDVDNLEKGGGSVRCCTLPLVRG